MKKKLMASVLAGLMAFGISMGTQAATRDEVAAINVATASDFQYWQDDSPTKAKLVKFVEEATNPNSPNYIPPGDRIATFDMDGTFYCETAPFYFQEMLFLHRALEDDSYQADKKMADFAQKIKPKIMNKEGLTPAENKTLLDYLTKAYAGLTPAEYRSIVRKFMDSNENGLTNLKRGEAFYLPMVEIISYLGNNGFEVYIDSACGVDTTRELVDGVIPIRPERILGTDFAYTSTKMGKEKADQHFYDRFNEKIVISGQRLRENGKTTKIYSILNQIGKRPVLAFGNSMGDSGMIEYTLQNDKYKSIGFFVLCDDTERELGNTAKADKLKKFAQERGWTTISMRDEFKTIYGDNVKVDR